ncbi:MAG TPA: hypothetical protein VJK02_24520 [Anaerolineales bacterium]|nr:hypothetical protein [Anaerolineales bacterium]
MSKRRLSRAGETGKPDREAVDHGRFLMGTQVLAWHRNGGAKRTNSSLGNGEEAPS